MQRPWQGQQSGDGFREIPLLDGHRGALNYALGEAKKKAKDPVKFDEATKNAGNCLLIDAEEAELCSWMIEQNKRLDGKDDDEVGTKVVAILKARQNVRNLFHGRRSAPLSTVVATCLKRGSPSSQWFKSFADRHADLLKKKRPSNMDTKRAKKAKFEVLSYQRYKSPCLVIILWSFWGSKLYSDQNLTFNEKRTNIKTIVYTLERESYLPTVSIYQPLMCPHTRF